MPSISNIVPSLVFIKRTSGATMPGAFGLPHQLDDPQGALLRISKHLPQPFHQVPGRGPPGGRCSAAFQRQCGPRVLRKLGAEGRQHFERRPGRLEVQSHLRRRGPAASTSANPARTFHQVIGLPQADAVGPLDRIEQGRRRPLRCEEPYTALVSNPYDPKSGIAFPAPRSPSRRASAHRYAQKSGHRRHGRDDRSRLSG